MIISAWTPPQDSPKGEASPIRPGFIGMSVWLLIVFTVLAGGEISAQTQGFKTASTNPFGEAEYYFQSGDLDQAKALYHAFLSANPGGKRVEKTLFRLGQIDQRKKSWATALKFYRVLLNKFPGTDFSPDAQFHKAQCHFELGRYSDAREFFRATARTHPDKKKQLESMWYLGRIDEKRFDYEGAIVKLAQLGHQGVEPDLKTRATEAIWKIIDEKLDKERVQRLVQRFQSGFPVDLLLTKMLSIYRNEGDRAGYHSTLLQLIRQFPDHPQKARIQNYLRQFERSPSPGPGPGPASGSGSGIKLGAVLPLTGKLALTGHKALQGIQLAINQLGFDGKRKIELIVRDSASGLPVSQIIDDLASDPGMVGVIGPMLSDEVKAAIPVAQKHQIPLFTPSASSAGLPQLSPYIFRNALTREIQAKFLADYAINHLNLRRFVILYPQETFGVELRDFFRREVRSLGGEVVGTVAYDRSQNDFKQQILDLGGVADDELYKLTRRRVLRNIDREEGGGGFSKPRVDMGLWTDNDIDNLKVSLELSYDAIFIPGFYDKVGLILPQLAFYNIDNVTLLGTSGWNSPELVKIAGNYLRSVFFVDGFFAGSKQPEVKDFVAQFRATFREEPTILSAQSYDVAKIYIRLILSGANSRLKVREQLLSVRNYPGVSGKTTMLPTGDSHKKLFALIVKRKKIVQEN